MNGDTTKRISQEGECRENGSDSLLESASETARRVLEEIEALAGTTACKTVQLTRLKKWAQAIGSTTAASSVISLTVNASLATREEIHDEFVRLGFHAEDNGEYYTNGQHDIFDAVDGNVLVGGDGHLYFIDTIIYPSDTGGYDLYKSLSPRCSGKK